MLRTIISGVWRVLPMSIEPCQRLFSIQAMPHCWAGAIAAAATLQVLSLFPPHYLGSKTGEEPMLEFDVYENPFRDQIVTKPFELKAGSFDVPTGPGLGVEIDEDVVKRYAKK